MKREAFRLRFDCADSFAIDEKKIFDFISALQKRFAKSKATSCGQINRAAVLNRPTAYNQQLVDLLAREFFGRRHEGRKLAEIYVREERKRALRLTWTWRSSKRDL